MKGDEQENYEIFILLMKECLKNWAVFYPEMKDKKGLVVSSKFKAKYEKLLQEKFQFPEAPYQFFEQKLAKSHDGINKKLGIFL